MTEKALDKLLTTILAKEYPFIEKIMVIKEERDINTKQPYKIFLGIPTRNMVGLDTEQLKNKVRKYCSYLLNPKEERISQIVFFDPNS